MLEWNGPDIGAEKIAISLLEIETLN